MVLVSALKEVFDKDINQVYNYLTEKNVEMIGTMVFIPNHKEKDRLIVEKLQNIGVLGRDLAGNRLGGNMLRFEVTSVSKRLQSYIEIIKINYLNE